MELKSVDAALLQKAVLAAAKGLEAKKEWINELNVFPVPDGDTGTNMTMTIMAAAREVAAIENPTMESIAKALSSGSLRGARGNSGVILSQLFRGFTKEIKESNEITVTSLANAFTRATETAYISRRFLAERRNVRFSTRTPGCDSSACSHCTPCFR